MMLEQFSLVFLGDSHVHDLEGCENYCNNMFAVLVLYNLLIQFLNAKIIHCSSLIIYVHIFEIHNNSKFDSATKSS